MRYLHAVLLFLLAVIIVFLSVLLYRACGYFQSPQIQAFSLIPDNASFIIKGKQTKDLLAFHKDNARFFSLFSSEKQQDRINYLFNNVLSREKYRQIAKNASIYLSLHNDSDEQWAVVLETLQKDNALLVDFMDFLRVDFEQKSFVYKNQKVYCLAIERDFLYLNSQNGVLLMTFSENLMRRAINKFEQNKDTLHSAINAIAAQSNENAKMYFYVQYQHFIPYFKNKIRKMGGDMAVLDMLKNCQWSVFELNVKKQNILLSGYTSVNLAENQSKLLIHKNNKLDFTKILPYNANHIFSVKANKSSDWKNIKSIVQTSEDLFALMYPTQILTFDIKNDAEVFHYLVIRSENTQEASFHLYNSLRSSFEENHYILDTFHIGSLLVGGIDLSNFVFAKLGITSHLTQLKYYTLIDNYFIFTDKKEGILACIEPLRANKTWSKSAEYQATQRYFTNEANMFYYCNFLNNNDFRLIRLQLYAQSDSLLLMDILLE